MDSTGCGGAIDFGRMREMNRSLILNVIRQEGSVSRAAIARRTRLSRSTVSSIVSELLEANLVHEVGRGRSSGGRRPILINLNYNAGYVVGVDLGATHLIILIANLNGDVVARRETDFSVAVGPDAGLKQIADAVRQCLADAGVPAERVRGLGMGVPGPVEYAEGRVVAPPIMPGWHGVALRDRLSRELGVPVYVDNDANLGALSEHCHGAGRGYANLAYIKVGTGIGCGLILGGQLYRGEFGSAGEIGHVTIDENGPPCKCGSYGCLESMAGGPAIALRAQQAIRAGQATSLAAIQPPESITARDVALAAQMGDKLAQQLFAEAGRHIGVALASLANLLNPGLIVIGGGVAQAGRLLLDPIRKTLEQRALQPVAQSTRVVQSVVGRDASALGAVDLALQEVFQSPALITCAAA
ncbi:MAG: ROK family transcriptional regulator [Anaerolineae bacterium]|nr:ROK family transcriptional regulator [Anaerolineae bacterium]